MNTLAGIHALLCDLDGVLHVGGSVVPGAPETVNRLRDRGLGFRFLTNTTTRPRRAVAAQLQALGFSIQEGEIFTAPRATADYLRRRGLQRCRLVVRDEVMAEFTGVTPAANRVDAVVIGDIGSAWNHALMQELFALVQGGAELVALHKGRFWQTADGLALDIGAYVAGLEYTTGKEATICGKPSPSFFQAALHDLGLPAARVAIVGDDIDSDVGGGQACGLKGILVQTGKYRPDHVARSTIVPDLTVPDINTLDQLFPESA